MQSFELPGSEAEWAAAIENMKIFAKQIKTSLKELGLGPFIGEISEMVDLPGSRSDWTRLLQDVTVEKLIDSWNMFLWNMKTGKYLRKFFVNHLLLFKSNCRRFCNS